MVYFTSSEKYFSAELAFCHNLWSARFTKAFLCSMLIGEYVFRHSSAHIVGEAMEKVYGGLLCYGPPVEEGFYYDMYIPPTAPQYVLLFVFVFFYFFFFFSETL